MVNNIQQWKSNYLELSDLVLETEGSDSKWIRLYSEWKEKMGDKILTHKYAHVLNIRTNEVFHDCTKRMLFAKMLLLTVARPVHTFIKTAYHICIPVSFIFEVQKSYQECQKDKTLNFYSNATKRCLRSLADIIRTPLYGIVSTIITIAAVLITPFKSTLLYDFRAVLHKVELSLNRKDLRSAWMLSICFRAFPLDDLIQKHSKKHADTSYEGMSTSMIALSNRTRFLVQSKRQYGYLHCPPCLNSWPRLRANEIYRSSILKTRTS